MASHSIGIETVGRVHTVLIPRNTPIPTQKYQTFTTYQNNQDSIGVQVFEGESILVKDCRKLGKLITGGIEMFLEL